MLCLLLVSLLFDSSLLYSHWYFTRPLYTTRSVKKHFNRPRVEGKTQHIQHEQHQATVERNRVEAAICLHPSGWAQSNQPVTETFLIILGPPGGCVKFLLVFTFTSDGGGFFLYCWDKCCWDNSRVPKIISHFLLTNLKKCCYSLVSFFLLFYFWFCSETRSCWTQTSMWMKQQKSPDPETDAQTQDSWQWIYTFLF